MVRRCRPLLFLTMSGVSASYSPDVTILGGSVMFSLRLAVVEINLVDSWEENVVVESRMNEDESGRKHVGRQAPFMSMELS